MIAGLLLHLLIAPIISSPGGRYQGIVEYRGGHELFAASFTLLADGEHCYTLDAPEARTFFVGDSGVVFAGNEQKLFLYDRRGQARRLRDLNYPNGFKYSRNQQFFFASDRDGIHIFSLAGEQVATGHRCRLFAASDDGRQLAAVSGDTLYLYRDFQFTGVRKLATPYARSIDFETDTRIRIEEPDGSEYFDIELK